MRVPLWHVEDSTSRKRKGGGLGRVLG